MDLHHADRTFLEACRDCPAYELVIVTVQEGRVLDDGLAMKAHAETMVRRGYLERVSVGGSKSRMQGAAMRATYRPTEAGTVAMVAVERAEAAEAARRPPAGRRRAS